MPLYSHHISTILPVFNFAWDSHCGYFPKCCWSLNRGDWGVFSISPVQIINQIFGIILIFDNDTTVKCIIEIGNNQRTGLEIKTLAWTGVRGLSVAQVVRRTDDEKIVPLVLNCSSYFVAVTRVYFQFLQLERMACILFARRKLAIFQYDIVWRYIDESELVGIQCMCTRKKGWNQKFFRWFYLQILYFWRGWEWNSILAVWQCHLVWSAYYLSTVIRYRTWILRFHFAKTKIFQARSEIIIAAIKLENYS